MPNVLLTECLHIPSTSYGDAGIPKHSAPLHLKLSDSRCSHSWGTNRGVAVPILSYLARPYVQVAQHQNEKRGDLRRDPCACETLSMN